MGPLIVVWLRIESGGLALLGRRKPDRPPFAGAWVLPGTAVPEEESAEETLRRYARDELGVTVREEEFAETLYVSDGPDNFVTNVFNVVQYEGQLRFSSAGDFQDMRWLGRDEVGDGSLAMPSELRSFLCGEGAPLGSPAALSEYAAQRKALLARISGALEGDLRVRAAWLSGSFGRGEEDEWSDLDLHVVVEDGDFETFWEQRLALYENLGSPVLIQQEMLSDAMEGALFQLVMFDGLLEVDWNIGPLSKARRPLAYRMLVERADIPVAAPQLLTAHERRSRAQEALVFFWAMAPIAVKYAGRGQTSRAVCQVALLTRTYVSLWRLANLPQPSDPALTWTNRPLEGDLERALPVLGAVIDPAAALDVIDGLCLAVQEQHAALSALGVTVPQEMPAQVSALSRLARASTQVGPRVGKFR